MSSLVNEMSFLKRMWYKVKNLSIQGTYAEPVPEKERRECEDIHVSSNEDPNSDNNQDLSGYQSDCSEIVTTSEYSRRKKLLSKWDRVEAANLFFKRRFNPTSSLIFTNYSSSTSSLTSSSSSNSTAEKLKLVSIETEPTHELLNQ